MGNLVNLALPETPEELDEVMIELIQSENPSDKLALAALLYNAGKVQMGKIRPAQRTAKDEALKVVLTNPPSEMEDGKVTTIHGNLIYVPGTEFPRYEADQLDEIADSYVQTAIAHARKITVRKPYIKFG
jgi:hypothetical protein